MNDSWEVYVTNVNDNAASILVNLGIGSSAPIEGHAVLLWVRVPLREPHQDGLASESEEEIETLSLLEDSLTEALQEQLGAYDVGRITIQGHRDFFYYVPAEKDAIAPVKAVLAKYPDYQFDTGIQPDPEWSHYFNLLYPSPKEYQHISNYKVLRQLEAAGDDLTKPRLVNHWIYFPSTTKRDEFLKIVTEMGYRLVEMSQLEKTESAYTFGLEIERVDNVDHESIDNAVLELFALANQMDGDYDGWETSVEN